ncbi:ABC transporter permease, partial [Vibrio sp. 10N.222.54.A1]
MEQTTTAPSRWERFKQSDILYYFLRDKVAMVSFAIFAAFLVMALAAPILAPTDPYDVTSIDIMDSELPPSWMEDGEERFLLGTDEQGRDILSTMLYGSRLSLTIGFLAVGL